MEHCRWGIWKLAGVGLAVLLIFSYSGGVKAAELQLENPTLLQIKKAVPARQKPPEKPPEVLPKYVTRKTPFASLGEYTATFGPGPITRMLTPYGHGKAEDTLVLGWKSNRVGPVKVSPYLTYDPLYRANAFQTYTNKNSDFVNTITPGIQFELPVAGTDKLSLKYLRNYFIYSQFSNISHYDQSLKADADLNFSKLSFRVGNAYRNATEEPTLVQNGPIFTFTQTRPHHRVTPYFNAAYKLADLWRFEANYQFDYLSYNKDIDRFDNYQYNTFEGTIFYKFRPKSSALIQYVAVMRTHPFDQTRDNSVQTPLVGLTWSPTARLTGTIKVGYTVASYSSNNPGGLLSYGSNPNGPSLSIQSLYKVSRFTRMSLVAQRSLQEDPDGADASYFNTGLLSTVTHFWRYFKVTSSASFSYYNNHYIIANFNPSTNEIKERDDNIIYAGVRLSRALTPHLRVRLNYLYYNRGSNFQFYPTNEHKLLVGLQATLP